MSRPLTLGEAEAKAEAENTLQEAKRATAAAQRDELARHPRSPNERWRRPPVADGNLHLPAGRTSTLGVCAHCDLALRLAFNEDAGEHTVAHEYPVCREWLARGILTIGKRGT